MIIITKGIGLEEENSIGKTKERLERRIGLLFQTYYLY